MVAIGGDHLVALFDQRLQADDDGLLADIEMQEAADLGLTVELGRALSKRRMSSISR